LVTSVSTEQRHGAFVENLNRNVAAELEQDRLDGVWQHGKPSK